jgi:UDP-N-acetylglucosamine:LPS N-acetylglucosamine transferase
MRSRKKVAKDIKLCVGASSGGHMTELIGLLQTQRTWPVQPSVYVTTREIWAKELRRRGKTYVVGECDRGKPLKIINTLIRSLWLVLRERPDVIITTGSLPIAIVCVVSKCFGAKVLWVDSIAQMDELSLSGNLMLRFADVLLVQWPEVAEKYGAVEYVGELQ